MLKHLAEIWDLCYAYQRLINDQLVLYNSTDKSEPCKNFYNNEMITITSLIIIK